MEEEYQNTPEFEEPPKLAYYNEAERQEEINKYQKFKKVDGAALKALHQIQEVKPSDHTTQKPQEPAIWSHNESRVPE